VSGCADDGGVVVAAVVAALKKLRTPFMLVPVPVRRHTL
jgi:hypothetical protein